MMDPNVVEPRPIASENVGHFLWQTDGHLSTLRRAQPPDAVRDGALHLRSFATAVGAWTALSVADAYSSPVVMGLGLLLMPFATALYARRCFDFERARGRSAVRRSLSIEVESEGSYRGQSLRMRVDDRDVPVAADARLVRIAWPHASNGVRGRPELSLVNGTDILVIEDHADEEDVDRIARLLVEAGRGALRVQRVAGQEWLDGAGGLAIRTLVTLLAGCTYFLLLQQFIDISRAPTGWPVALFAISAATLPLLTLHVLATHLTASPWTAKVLRETYGIARPRRRGGYSKAWLAIVTALAAVLVTWASSAP